MFGPTSATPGVLEGDAASIVNSENSTWKRSQCRRGVYTIPGYVGKILPVGDSWEAESGWAQEPKIPVWSIEFASISSWLVCGIIAEFEDAGREPTTPCVLAGGAVLISDLE